MVNQIYHEEDREFHDEARRKQEATKNLLLSIFAQTEIIESWKILYGIEINPELAEIIRIDLDESPDPFEIDSFDDDFELGTYQNFEDNSDIEDDGDPEDNEFDEGFFDNVVVFRKHILFVTKLNKDSLYQIEYASEMVNEHTSFVIMPTEYSIDSLGRVCDGKEEC